MLWGIIIAFSLFFALEVFAEITHAVSYRPNLFIALEINVQKIDARIYCGGVYPSRMRIPEFMEAG